MTIHLPRSLAAWETPVFRGVLVEELRSLGAGALPLHLCLSRTSRVGDGELNPVVLNVECSDDRIRVRIGVFFPGVDAGSCCADDPGTVCEETEHGVFLLEIDRDSADTRVILDD